MVIKVFGVSCPDCGVMWQGAKSSYDCFDCPECGRRLIEKDVREPHYIHHSDLSNNNKLNESFIEQAWNEFCEKRGWTGKIQDGYTAVFHAFDKNGNLVYEELIGE